MSTDNSNLGDDTAWYNDAARWEEDLRAENPPPAPVVRYNTDRGIPSFDLSVPGTSNWYEVEVSRCDTAAKLVDWIAHLLAKRWVTRTQIRQFIDLVVKHQPGIRHFDC
jgi:hypothetical protein